ncbi:MAG: hypothetical protein EXS59_01850 [Candidatus Taylorbacteria bacterium]|nr:hypothetical protein [Candidatus Taylorbacteria bacterium]
MAMVSTEPEKTAATVLGATSGYFSGALSVPGWKRGHGSNVMAIRETHSSRSLFLILTRHRSDPSFTTTVAILPLTHERFLYVEKEGWKW